MGPVASIWAQGTWEIMHGFSIKQHTTTILLQTSLSESIHQFLSSWLAIASIYQLVAMSLKRCLMVWRPFLERQVQLWHKAIGVVFVYTISAAIIIPLALDSSQSAVPFIAS
uniref:Uncharacterized protein n=1 Tax=Plectus sambesii TaxID=2011161 RepID=A0A914W568_9BILA